MLNDKSGCFYLNFFETIGSKTFASAKAVFTPSIVSLLNMSEETQGIKSWAEPSIMSFGSRTPFLVNLVVKL
jgi:hypothetical protein